VENAKCLENKIVTNGVQEEITERNYRKCEKILPIRYVYTLEMGGADTGKNMSIHKLFCAYLNAENRNIDVKQGV
jgi:hypothetical protein